MPGQCYLNIEDSIYALGTLVEMWELIFYPWEWAKLTLAAMDFARVWTSLYSKCAVNKVMDSAMSMLTYEGASQLVVRTVLSVTGGDISKYYTIYQLSTDWCVSGQALGKIMVMILDYTI